MISEALMTKYRVEMAGGRHVAVVDGKKQYLSDVAKDGTVFINELGLRLQEEMASEPAPAPVAKPKREKKAEVEVDDVQLDV